MKVMMKLSRRDWWVAGISVIATVMALGWSWRTFWGRPPIPLALHQGVGGRLAGETARVIGEQGGIVLVTLERRASRIVDAQRDAFVEGLKKWPRIKIIREEEVDPEKSAKFGPGSGMSARRYLKLRAKFPEAAAVVSLIGAPDSEDFKAGDAITGEPRFLAVSRSYKKLLPLIERGGLELAIVPRFVFPAPDLVGRPTPEDWFENRFQVVGKPGEVR